MSLRSLSQRGSKLREWRKKGGTSNFLCLGQGGGVALVRAWRFGWLVWPWDCLSSALSGRGMVMNWWTWVKGLGSQCLKPSPYSQSAGREQLWWAFFPTYNFLVGLWVSQLEMVEVFLSWHFQEYLVVPINVKCPLYLFFFKYYFFPFLCLKCDNFLIWQSFSHSLSW